MPSLATGAVVSHYRVLAPLGAGGMGEVYLAEDLTLGRRVALKVLPQATVADPEARRRLLREARAAARLEHPNICAVYEVGEDGPHSFLVLQFVAGGTLTWRSTRQQIELDDALKIALQLADGLGTAHEHGVVHGDIKPQNIMFDSRGQVKLLDFGLAIHDDGHHGPHQPEASAAASAKVATGGDGLAGSPGAGSVHYMAPEQLRGAPAGPRSDVFAVGVVLLELVTGRHPFPGAHFAEVVAAVLDAEPFGLSELATSHPRLAAVLSRALAKDPLARPANASALRDELVELTQPANGRVDARPDVSEPAATGAVSVLTRFRAFFS